MTKMHKTLLILLLALLLLVPLGMTVKKVYREVRQPELNRALIAAIKKNNTSAVVTLLSEGADPNAGSLPPDPRPLWRQMWDRLRGKHPPTGHAHNALLTALAMKEVEDWSSDTFPPENVVLIKTLLDAGAAVNAADEDGSTPLIWASMGAKRETVRLLLDRGARVNTKDSQGFTALHSAVDEHDLTLVELLLAQGALVNATNNYGVTPLQSAAGLGNIQSVRLLLGKGALVNAHDADGDTPLSDAASGNRTDCVQLLLACGARVDTRNNGGETPLSCAQDNRNTEMIKMLRAAASRQKAHARK